MKVKKTSSEIKMNILNELKTGPKTIAEIGDSISSNWLTTEKFLKELKEEKKVKELLSTDKKKVYQIITGDTYFNIPIIEDQRKKFKTLFYMILKKYSEYNKIPTKTEFSKCAVRVIKEGNNEFSDLPVIWYLYGMIPLMVADPSEKYNKDYKIKDETRIIKIIGNYCIENYKKTPKQIEKDQHKLLGDELYILADQFRTEINKNDFDKENILNILDRFFIECPIDEEFLDVFEFTEKFIMTIGKLSEFVDIHDYRKEIISTFESLWNYIKTYKVYQSIDKLKIFPKKEIILQSSVGNMLDFRKDCFNESFSDLHSIYMSNLTDKEIILSEDEKKARDILEGMY